MKLTIGYFYKDLLNLYGDNGNVEILLYRAKKRGFDTELVNISIDTKITTELVKNINMVFMGGGPDSSQKAIYQDLLDDKKDFLKGYIDKGGVGLYVCGSYQLLGKYYKAADGSYLKGLSIFDLYTQHFGNQKKRCIGNTVAKLLINDSLLERTPSTIVGFENHGGRTFLGKEANPFAKIIKGHGNNSQDGTEGVYYKNSIGTYFHGPVLARNPHLADYLIAKSLKLDTIKPLDDSLAYSAHTASLKLKR
ncbi:glutamine amidotransferase [Patescibacteria group bacterium]|nr:glutamine amidotransferase [Patescibacteria group bacterium]